MACLGKHRRIKKFKEQKIQKFCEIQRLLRFSIEYFLRCYNFLTTFCYLPFDLRRVTWSNLLHLYQQLTKNSREQLMPSTKMALRRKIEHRYLSATTIQFLLRRSLTKALGHVNLNVWIVWINSIGEKKKKIPKKHH